MARQARGRISFRDKIRANQRALKHLAAMAGREQHPDTILELPPKRTRARRSERPGGGEAAVNREIQRVCGDHDDVRLWRNNRGTAIQEGGAVVRYGVGPNGAADWIGYQRITITPAMVGTEVAVFVAIEAKAPGKNPNEDQERFLGAVGDAGGISGVARSGADALDILGK